MSNRSRKLSVKCHRFHLKSRDCDLDETCRRNDRRRNFSDRSFRNRSRTRSLMHQRILIAIAVRAYAIRLDYHRFVVMSAGYTRRVSQFQTDFLADRDRRLAGSRRASVLRRGTRGRLPVTLPLSNRQKIDRQVASRFIGISSFRHFTFFLSRGTRTTNGRL